MDTLLKKTFVVVVENGTEDNSDKVCFMRSVIDNGKVYNEFSPLRSKAHHFETKEDADKCCESIKDSGYFSWVETFYKV